MRVPSSSTSARAQTTLGEAVETFIRREDAEHFVEDVCGDDPELASHLRIEERELETYIVWLTRLRMLPSGSLNHTALKSSAMCTSPSRVVSGRS